MFKNSLIFFIIFILIKIILPLPICKEGENFCSKCNPVTKLCEKCEINNIFKPDNKGGCEGSKKCEIGLNRCSLCDSDNKLCTQCEKNYFPDENGGCSLTDNCEISYQGNCLKCIEDFILVGTSIKICKSLNSDDLAFCDEIDTETGFCKKCEEDSFLNSGDKKCCTQEHCHESLFGVCTKCSNSYYLDKSKDKCLPKNETWINCELTLDGKTCAKCEDDSYFDDEGNCIGVKYCSKGAPFVKCKQCKEGYYLAKYGNCCSKEPNCDYGDKDLGICTQCLSFYYIDFKDGKCKPNNLDNDYKYCTKADGECYQCVSGSYLGEDKKCSLSRYCAVSYLGNCTHCIKDYHLGRDNICTNIDKCVISNYYNSCEECEEGYYFNISSNKCMSEITDFENCQKTDSSGIYCAQCRKDFYLNKTDNLCYSNLEKNNFYKCSIAYDNICQACVQDYWLGYIDKKCTLIEGCEISESEDKCIQCDAESYCLNKKTGKCFNNEIIDDEDIKYYYRCNMTNDEGNACEICINDYILNDKGYCEYPDFCETYDGKGNCIQCIKIDDEDYIFYCINEDFGCTVTYAYGCEMCNNSTNFDWCTKCSEGYNLEDGQCIKIE